MPKQQNFSSEILFFIAFAHKLHGALSPFPINWGRAPLEYYST